MTDTEKVLQLIASHFRCRVEDIKSRNRSAHFVRPRFMAIWFLRNTENLSSPVIGRLLGGRDHTSILYAERRAEDMFIVDLEMNAAKTCLLERHAQIFAARSLTRHKFKTKLNGGFSHVR